MNPIFVLSSVRSGSTLFRLLMNSHPSIRNPGEFDYLFDHVSDEGRYPSLIDYKQFLSTDRIFQAHKLIINEQLNFPELIYSFVEQSHKPDEILAMNVHRNFHRIPALFPDALYIHLLRDPRDVARSCMGMGWVGHVYYGVDIWIKAQLSWERLKPSLDESKFIEIKYEELLENVELGLAEICNFAGVEYSDAMLDYVEHSNYDLPDKHLAYQWKKKYSTRQLMLAEGKLGAMIEYCGYRPSGVKPIRPGVLERIYLFVMNKQYRARFWINRYGFYLYLQRAICTRIGSSKWKSRVFQKTNQIDTKHLK